MRPSFYTIKENVNSELIEKKSRFIAQVFYVTSENEVNQKLEEVRKANKEAKHHAYAFRLENGLERYSDDGEPSGTAGMPILETLRGSTLMNVLVVVTRYFGGILLGTGGLVRSYGGVAKQAIDKACKVEMKLCMEYKVMIDYDLYSSVQYYCKNHEVQILATNFLNQIEMSVLVIHSVSSIFLHDVKEITNGKAVCEELKEYYHE